MRRSLAAFLAALGLVHADARAQSGLVLKENMEVLKCAPPDARARFAGSTAPGQPLFPDEPVEIRLVLSKGPADVAVEIQEITTRDPARKAKGGFTDTAGDAPLLGLEGKPVLHKFDVKL